MLRLVVTAGNQRGKVFDLPELKKYLLGRGVEADIEVLDIAASRRHAAIWLDTQESGEVQDLGSLNGITINGRDSGKCRLRDGDRLVIGETEMLVSFAAEGAATESERITLTGTDTDMTEFMSALKFCEKCNESVGVADVEQGRAAEIDGKLYCGNCLREMSDAQEG